MGQVAYDNIRIASEGQKQSDISAAYASLTGAAQANAVRSAERRHRARVWQAAGPNGMVATQEFAELQANRAPTENFTRTDTTTFNLLGWKYQIAIAANFGTFAASTVTNATKPTAGDTFTVGSQVYTFQDTIAAPFDVFIGATDATALANLAAAILATANVGGLQYFAGTTPNTKVTATSTATTLVLNAITAGAGGNALTVAGTTAGQSYNPGSALLAGAVNGTIALNDANSSARMTFTQNATQTIELPYGTYAFALTNSSGMTATIATGNYSDGSGQTP
jgi:hypothetical protein